MFHKLSFVLALNNSKTLFKSISLSNRSLSSSNIKIDILNDVINIIKSSNNDKISDNLISKLSHVSNDKISDVIGSALWTLVNKREYNKVISTYESLVLSSSIPSLSVFPKQILLSNTSIYATMAAYGHLRKPHQARKLASTLEIESITTATSPSTANLILYAYCESDRLEMVESFFTAWINIHVINGNEEMKKLSSIFSSWKIPKINDGPISSKVTISNKNKNKNNLIDSNNDIEALKINALGLSGVEYEILKQHPPDMKSFCHLLKLYSGRKAWIPCYHILKFIESGSLQSSLSPLNSNNNETKLNCIDIMYYYTVKAMCDSEQFSLAIELVNNMQKKTGKLSNIGIVSQLLKVLSLPILDNNNEIVSNKLLTDIGETIVLLTNIKIDSENDHNLDYNNRLDEFKDINQVFLNSELVSTYIRALCKRGMISNADEMIEKLYNSNDTGRLLISEKSLTQLIHVLSIHGYWEKSLIWFNRLPQLSDNIELVSPTSMPFHHICQSLRNAGEMERLVKFMTPPHYDVV